MARAQEKMRPVSARSLGGYGTLVTVQDVVKASGPVSRPQSAAHRVSAAAAAAAAANAAAMSSPPPSQSQVQPPAPQSPPPLPVAPPSSATPRRARPVSAGGASGVRAVAAAAELAPSAATGRRVLPAELGLAGRRVLTLPSHVEQCNQGEQCCWRWLAHAVLKEASWLKEDLDSAREEHSQYARERLKAEHDAEAYAELRGAHAETQRELSECRAEAGDLRRELAALRTAHAHKAAREQELEREIQRLDKERRDTGTREVAALRRADVAERELAKVAAVAEEQHRSILQMEDMKARLGADLQEARNERDTLRKAAEEAAAAKKKKKGARAKAEGQPGPIKPPGQRPASTPRR